MATVVWGRSHLKVGSRESIQKKKKSFSSSKCRIGIDIYIYLALGRIPILSPYHVEEGLSLKQETMEVVITSGLKEEVEEFVFSEPNQNWTIQ